MDTVSHKGVENIILRKVEMLAMSIFEASPKAIHDSMVMGSSLPTPVPAGDLFLASMPG